jgi:hypothetical protein
MPVPLPTFIAVGERGFVPVMAVGDKERPPREGRRKPALHRGIGHNAQSMGSAHLVLVLEGLSAFGVIGDQLRNLAVGIPVQEIEWTQVGSDCPESTEAFLSGTARCLLVR